MTDASRTVALPLLFPPRLDRLEEQRVYFPQRFAEYAQHLARCREDQSYCFTVTDLDAFRAFFDSSTEDRIAIRELVAAQRITVPHALLPRESHPLQLELWRRNMLYGARCWEGLLGGTLDAEGTELSVRTDESNPLRAATSATAALLVEAEKLSSLALLAGTRYPEEELDRAWRQLLFAQRGLSAQGAPQDNWYVDVLAACREAAEVAVAIHLQAMIALSLQVNTAAAKGAVANGAALLVVNLSGLPYSGPCAARVLLTGGLASGLELRDPRGHRVPCQVTATGASPDGPWVDIAFEVAAMPAIGYRTYALRPARMATPSPGEEGPPPIWTIRQTTVHPGVLPPELSLLAADVPEAEILVLKPGAAPLADIRAEVVAAPEDGFLVRLRLPASAPSLTLESELELVAAWQVDALDRKSGELPVTRGAWRRPPQVTMPLAEERTISLTLQFALPAAAPTEAGATSASPRRVYSRYWQHNLGAAPTGNAPLGLWVGGVLPLGKNTRFPVHLSNDSADREYTGSVDLSAPEQWTLIPRRFPYRLPVRGHGLFEAMVIVPPDATPCFLRVETPDGDRLVQDVLPIGEIQPLELHLARREAGFELTISNPNPDYIEGQAALATPLGPAEQLVQSASHLQSFRLPAGGTISLNFTGDSAPPAWAVARVAWYNHVQYVRVEA